MDEISRITAIHEAAHAVAAIRAGLVFDTVSALPDEQHELDGALYWTELQDSGELAMPPELLAVVSLAGPCAEARVRGQRFDRMFSGVAATDDRESVAALGLSEEQFVAACRETIEPHRARLGAHRAGGGEAGRRAGASVRRSRELVDDAPLS